MLSPQLLVARVKAAHVGLQTKLLSHPGGGGQLFLVLGAPLGRLAREAERIGMAAQLKPEIEKRMVLDKVSLTRTLTLALALTLTLALTLALALALALALTR